MQKIDDFDWNYLYAKAEEYIKEFIPEAHVNHGTIDSSRCESNRRCFLSGKRK